MLHQMYKYAKIINIYNVGFTTLAAVLIWMGIMDFHMLGKSYQAAVMVIFTISE
jgi:hypothetical protein